MYRTFEEARRHRESYLISADKDTVQNNAKKEEDRKKEQQGAGK